MTNNDKTTYLRIGLSLMGITSNDVTCEKIWRIYEGILEKNGEFTISDAMKIESEIDTKMLIAARKKKVSFEKKKRTK